MKEKESMTGTEKRTTPVSYAAWCSQREQSSSGGAFFVFAKYVIEQGGIVFGAAYNENLHVGHVAAKTLSEVEMLRKSKYVQSDIGYSYRMAKEYLEDGKMVLFSGCPCQIAAIRSYLSRDYDNLYLIDVLCDSALPIGIYNEYIKELQEKYQKKITKLDFRNKKFGWKCGALQIEFEDGSSADILKDKYMDGFMSGLYRSRACLSCNYAEIPRPGDITLGDFWRIEELHPELNDNKGTSLILVSTKKGKQLLENTKREFAVLREVDLNLAKKRNRFFSNWEQNRNSQRFYELHKTRPLIKSINDTLKQHYDITVIGNWSAVNYGAHLTYYALYQKLTDEGYSVLMLEKPNTPPFPPNAVPRLFIENPYPAYALSPIYDSLSDMLDLNERCDIFITGSDQLWNPDLFGHSMEFYSQAFIGGGKKKISYATSFGNPAPGIDGEYGSRMGFLLNRFHYHSVREDFGVSLMKDIFDIEAEFVLDPVFLCDISHYERLAAKSKYSSMEEPYIFCYVIHPDDEKIRQIKKISEYKHYRLICVGDALKPASAYSGKGIEWVSGAKIEDWICLIKNSSLVVADSFHATCFSIIFERDFIVLSNYTAMQYHHERMRSLLNILSLSDRLFILREGEIRMKELYRMADTPVSYAGIPADSPNSSKPTGITDKTSGAVYGNVREILKRERERSFSWLNNAIKTPFPKQKPDFWDAYGSEILKTRDFISEIQPIVNRIKKEQHFKKITERKFKALKAADGAIIVNRRSENMKHIVAFGTGGYFRRNLKKIKEFTHLDFVCDNSPNKWGQDYGNGIVCVPPEKIKELDDVFVLITVDNPAIATSIIIQLLEMGITSFEHADNCLKN